MKKNTDIVIGLQWGDEGKGKIVDLLLNKNKYDLVIRANGGNNAGHSIKIGNNEFVVHALPSGMLQNTINIIGPGCVVNAKAVVEELNSLKNFIKGKLVISDKVPLVLKRHIEADKQQELIKGSNSIGTTLRGIGPAYADLKNRNTVFAGDLLNIEKTIERFSYLKSEEKESLRAELEEYKTLIGKYIQNIRPLIKNASKILIEGAQATMLDNLYGSYPYVTSSSTIVSGLLMGSGLNHLNVRKVYGVMKMYATRVGNGPFVTEMEPEIASKVRKIGKEIGVSTGRERRCGWLDLIQLKEAVNLNGVTELCLIKSDVLDSFEDINICVSYKNKEVNYDSIPYDTEHIKPIYFVLPGWKEKTFEKIYKTRNEIPGKLLNVIDLIENDLEVPVTILSTGQGRESTSFLSKKP